MKNTDDNVKKSIDKIEDVEKNIDKVEDVKDSDQSSDRVLYKKVMAKRLLNKSFNWIVLTVIIIILGVGSYIGYNLYTKFKQTEVWEKSSNVKYADIEPYMLYLSDEEFAELKNYNKSVSNIYNKTSGEINTGITSKDIDNLKTQYNKLPNNIKSKEEDLFTRITNIWELQSDYKKLLNKNGQISSKTKLSQIKIYIDDNSKNLVKMLEDDKDTSEKKYLKELYNSLDKLSDDLSTMVELINIFDKTYTLTNKDVYVKKDVSSVSLTNWENTKKKLNYNWGVIDEYLTPIVDSSVSVLSKHDEQIHKVDLYNSAVKEKGKYETFINNYNSLINQLIELKDFSKLEDIEDWAKNNNLKLNITHEYSDEVKKDYIISQTPNSTGYKKILSGSTISVVVSDGTKPISSSTSSSNSDTSSSSSSRTETSSSTYSN